jgi:hypothetical protein
MWNRALDEARERIDALLAVGNTTRKPHRESLEGPTISNDAFPSVPPEFQPAFNPTQVAATQFTASASAQVRPCPLLRVSLG